MTSGTTRPPGGRRLGALRLPRGSLMLGRLMSGGLMLGAVLCVAWLLTPQPTGLDLDRGIAVEPGRPEREVLSAGPSAPAAVRGAERAPAGPGESRLGPESARGTLGVVATTEDGLPVQAVAFRIVALDGRPDHSSARDGVTADDGFLRFDDLAPGRWTVTLQRSSDERTVEVAPRTTTTVGFTLPDAADARVRVVDGRGRAVPGATVLGWPTNRWLEQPKGVVGSTIGVTDADGVLEVPHRVGIGQMGSAWFAARHPRLGASVAVLAYRLPDDRDRAADPVEVVLELGSLRGGTLDLRLVDESGTPLQGAVATAGIVDGPSTDAGPPRTLAALKREARSDASGRAVLSPLTPGRYVVRARAEGRVDGVIEVEIPSATSRITRDLELRAGRTLLGSVVDASTGVGIGGATVETPGIETPTTRTDAAGRFVLEGVPGRGDVVCTASRRGYRPGRYEGPLPASIELEALPHFAGRLVDSRSRPLSGWRALVWGTQPDEGGRWTARASSDTGGHFRVPLPTRHGERFDGVLLLYPPEARIPVLLPDWVVPGAVQASDPAAGPGDARDGAAGIVVPDAALPTAGIAGVLVDERGRPFRDARAVSLTLDLGVHPRFAGFSARRTVRTDAETSWPTNAVRPDTAGAFRIEDVPAGTYELSCVTGDSSLTLGDVRLEAGRVRDLGQVVVPSLGTVEVLFDHRDGFRPDSLSLQLDRAPDFQDIRGCDPGTQQVRVPVQPGSYTVTVFGTGFPWVIHRGVVVEAGRTTSLEAILRPGFRVPLRFALPENEESARFEVRDAHGDVVVTTELPSEWGASISPFLAPGRFEAVAVGGSGARYLVRFAVEPLRPDQARHDPIEIRPR